MTKNSHTVNLDDTNYSPSDILASSANSCDRYLTQETLSKVMTWTAIIIGMYIVAYILAIMITGGFLWGYQYKRDCYSFFDTKAVYASGRVTDNNNETGVVKVVYDHGNAQIIPTSNSTVQAILPAEFAFQAL